MDVERLQEALKDFEKRGKKEVCPILDQFLCHVAKTGETMVQWSQFKGYFIFKLEKVMDDFRTSAPEPRGPPNPNVEYIPFEEMKERILKIVTGFNGLDGLNTCHKLSHHGCAAQYSLRDFQSFSQLVDK